MSGVTETTLSGATAPYNYTTLATPNDVTIVDNTAGSVFGGIGASTTHGAISSDLTFVGGSGAATVYGGDSATLWGSTGSGDTLLVGGKNVFERAYGTGNTTLIAGTGTSVLDGTRSTGSEVFFSNPFGSTSTVMTLNNSADTVISGTGATSVNSGTGSNVFGFISGHAGGSETIYNFNATSTIVFQGYGSKPIVSENASSGSDVITLADGTTITLDQIAHKVFNGIGS